MAQRRKKNEEEEKIIEIERGRYSYDAYIRLLNKKKDRRKRPKAQPENCQRRNGKTR